VTSFNQSSAAQSAEAESSDWSEFLTKFKDAIGPFEFQVFANELRLLNDGEDTITICVPKPFHKKWLEDKHASSLRETFEAVYGEDRDVEITVDKESSSPSSDTEKDESSSNEDKQKVNRKFPFANKVDFNPHFTFDQFVVGQSNQYAYNAARSVAESPAESYNPLFLYGDVGLGKTHLLQAIGQDVKSQWEQASVKYISAEQFMNDILRSIQQNTIKEFQYRFRKNIDMLLVDDIQFLAKSEKAQEEFFHTFEELVQNGKTAVFCGDRPPHEISKIEERLRSRFEMGLIVDIQPPDYETRIAILRKKAQDDGFDIPDDVIEFIASNVVSNVRVLKGCLNNLAAIGSMSGEQLTVDMAREQLSNYLDNQPGTRSDPVSIEAIQRAVSDHFNLSVGDLQSKRRTKAIAEPRQVAMYLARRHTNASYADIGEAFGGRDHSTVIHAEEKIENALQERSTLADQVNRVEDNLND
jgi:chromosomal replication initiator protein